MEYFAEAGFTGYHFESRIDAYEAKRVVAGRCAARQITAQHPAAGHAEGREARGQYAIEAGVDVARPRMRHPRITPNRNLLALVAAARSTGLAPERRQSELQTAGGRPWR